MEAEPVGDREDGESGDPPPWWPWLEHPVRINEDQVALGWMLGVVLVATPFVLGVRVIALGIETGHRGNLAFGVAAILAGLAFGTWLVISHRSTTLHGDRVVSAGFFRESQLPIADLRRVDMITVQRRSKRRRWTDHIIRLHWPEQVWELPPDEQPAEARSELARVRQAYEPIIESHSWWLRTPTPIEAAAFGAGVGTGFERFTDFSSIVKTTSIEDVAAWLRGCAFERTGQEWLHPADFEAWRHGGSADHAVWAWRRLAQLGHDCEFVVGGLDGVAHAWVMVHLDGERRIFDTSRKEGPLFAHRVYGKVLYRPTAGIDGALRTYLYGPQA